MMRRNLSGQSLRAISQGNPSGPSLKISFRTFGLRRGRGSFNRVGERVICVPKPFGRRDLVNSTQGHDFGHITH